MGIYKSSRISRYKILQLVECFCSDMSATETAQTVRLNRKTVNRYFAVFRRAIFEQLCSADIAYPGAAEREGCHFDTARGGRLHDGNDELYRFAKKRLAKFNGVKKNYGHHLKECQWRYNKTTDQLMSELRTFISRTKPRSVEPPMKGSRPAKSLRIPETIVAPSNTVRQSVTLAV